MFKWFGGSDPARLIENHDWIKLWKHWRKKYPQELRYVEHANDLWDATQVGFKPSRDMIDVAILATYLIEQDRAYAGARQPVTPVEYQSRYEVSLSRAPRKPDALCPGCDHYLSEDPIPSERGMYRACTSCGRLVHRNCGSNIHECPKCGGTAWTWSLRTV